MRKLSEVVIPEWTEAFKQITKQELLRLCCMKLLFQERMWFYN